MDDLWVEIRSVYFYVHNSSLQIDENNFCGWLTFRIFTLFLPNNFRLPFRFPFFPNGNLCSFCPMSFFFFFDPMDNRLNLWLLSKHLLPERKLPTEVLVQRHELAENGY